MSGACERVNGRDLRRGCGKGVGELKVGVIWEMRGKELKV